MIERFPRPTVLPGSLGNWLETFAQPLLTPVFGDTRSRILADVSDALRAQLFRDGKWTADYVRLRFAARATSF